MQLGLEWKWSGRMYSKADLSKQKWNGLVSCSKCSYFGTYLFKEGMAGGKGAGNESLYIN